MNYLKSRQMRRASRVFLSIFFEIFRFSFLESLKIFRKLDSLKDLEK
jgi:hypothetical protein